MNLMNEFNKYRMIYQARYVRYLSHFDKTGDMDSHGHAMECSYILISVFGLTDNEIKQLEKNDYAGLLDRDLEG